MTTAEKLRANILGHMKNHDKMSQRALARAVPMSQGALSAFLSGKNSSLTFDSMAGIAAVFLVTVGALLGEETAGAETPDGIISIQLNDIIDSPLNPRKQFGNAEIAHLAVDIKDKGLLQNLIVRANPDRPGSWILVVGERRLRAIRLLDFNGDWPADRSIAARVIEAGERKHILTALAENLEREDLSPLEEAAAYHSLVNFYGMKPLEIGGMVGRDKRHVLYRLKLVDLNDYAAGYLRDGLFGPSIGRQVARLGFEDQTDIVDLMFAGKQEISESAVTIAVNELLAPAAAGDKQTDIEDPSANAQDEAPAGGDGETNGHPPRAEIDDKNGAEIRRLEFPGDMDAWVEVRHVGGGLWQGYYCSPAHRAMAENGNEVQTVAEQGEAAFSWRRPSQAIAAAATMLAVRERELRIDYADIDDAAEIMDWANDVGKFYYNAEPVEMPGAPGKNDQAPSRGEYFGEDPNEMATHEQSDIAEAEPPAHATLEDVVEMGEDGMPVPRPGYFIDHPRALPLDYQFTRVMTLGIGEMPAEITLYDPRNQAHAEYVRKEDGQ